MDAVRDLLDHWTLVIGWLVLVALSLGVLFWDLRTNNPEIAGMMKLVWGLSVAYSGPFGLYVYYLAGRKQIPHDSTLRRGWRSVAHCYSGCGGGEIVGVLIAVGILSLGNIWVAVTTFLLAYAAGYALTMGPLIQEGVPFRDAMRDALYSETASITVMEIVAISVDLALAGNATMREPLFWASLVVSLFFGYVTAWPVNVLLIQRGVKEGMGNPREAHAH